jgi:hypothetical protein
VLDWNRPVALQLGRVRCDESNPPATSMKPEYNEGPEATANFKRFATAILQANPQNKKKQVRNPASKRKPKKSDRD